MTVRAQERLSAFAKIQRTARSMRNPKDGAGGPELALSTLTQMLSSPQAQGWLQGAQEEGALDPFLQVLAVWLCHHRSDDSPLLLVVEVPRYRPLPAGMILKHVEEARQVALGPPPDLTTIGEDDEVEVDGYAPPPPPVITP